ncbi:hypothetical protein PHYBOEH_005288 [Phytophthora boehmeriae]|uniref:Uncharacterized protein n=1 Tax=Phytophthora boehmeriae TaxID=109152 RepID=A0A8T1WLR1_9STRA|nr:hypothetical protein PHYBOEH_005288 [Phytophthora boehmeriae]
MATSNPLDRLREQRAMKLLQTLQGDLRSQIRLESEEFGRNENLVASLRRKTRIARLANPQERERIWSREQLPSYEGEAIRSLPKSREFWRDVDVPSIEFINRSKINSHSVRFANKYLLSVSRKPVPVLASYAPEE